MNKGYQKFFLGANSGEGFVSAFSSSYDAEDGWRSYIIKGGPGTGKSSFMKHFASHAAQLGEEIILCPCSSDPNSLDGVILPMRKIVILDGTAPHIVEPQLPGVCGEIVNLGAFWNSEILRKNSADIIAVTKENARLHKKASGYLRATGQILNNSLRIGEDCTDKARCRKFANALCKKLLPACNTVSKEWVRFLQGVTPVGLVGFVNSVNDFYSKKIIVSDGIGCVANQIMLTVREAALQNGYEIITVKNPFLPSAVIDHILIPSLSLAFVTENSLMNFGGEERRIHARRFTDVSKLHNYRSRLKFNGKVMRELILEASCVLAEAKAVHDVLEKYYIDAMDFKALTQYAEDFTKKALG